MRIRLFFVALVAALVLASCADERLDGERTVLFETYDIVHSADAPSADRQGKIEIDRSDRVWNDGDVVWLERDGRFMVRDKSGRWSPRWMLSAAYGTWDGKGVRPVEGVRYVCRQSGLAYRASGGKLVGDSEEQAGPYRIMSWNIGCFSKGNSSRPVVGSIDEYEAMMSDFREPLRVFSPDLAGICEFVPSIMEGREVTDDLFGDYSGCAVSWLTDHYMGKALLAHTKIRNVRQIKMPDSIVLEGEAVLGGRPFIVAVCHASWGRTRRNDLNLKDLKALSERYRYMPNVILMGDFNVYKFREAESWQLFVDAGFTPANGGEWGTMVTTYNSQLCSSAIDNILVKGARIVAVETLQVTPEGLDPHNPRIEDEALWDAVNLSDHFPLCATIEL